MVVTDRLTAKPAANLPPVFINGRGAGPAAPEGRVIGAPEVRSSDAAVIRENRHS